MKSFLIIVSLALFASVGFATSILKVEKSAKAPVISAPVVGSPDDSYVPMTTGGFIKKVYKLDPPKPKVVEKPKVKKTKENQKKDEVKPESDKETDEDDDSEESEESEEETTDEETEEE